MSRFRQRIVSTFLVEPSGSLAEFDWPAQSPGYQSALPRTAGYGMSSYGGSGRDGAEGRVVVFLQDDFTNGSSVNAAYGAYTRIRHGNAEGCAAYKLSNPSTPVIMVPISSGTVNKRDDITFGSYFDYYGQFAPGAGVVWRETQVRTIISFGGGGSSAVHQRYWHMDCRMGDTAGGSIPSPNRDGFIAGAPNSDGSQRASEIVLINCSFAWSMDELFDAYYGIDLLHMVYCAFIEPLHKSWHDDTGTVDDGVGIDAHGYGPIIGGGHYAGRVSINRCLFAHTSGRQPMVAAEKFAYANNLIYNPGDGDGNLSTGVQLIPADAAIPLYANITDNLMIAGPDSYTSDFYFVHGNSGGPPTSSQGYIVGNAATGWTFATQLDLKAGTFPGGYDAGSLLTTAWPNGWGTAREGIQRIGPSDTTPNAYSSSDMLIFAQLIAESVGPLPGARTAQNRAGVVAEHPVNYLSSSGDEGDIINSVGGTEAVGGANPWPDASRRYAPNAGDWPSMGSTTVDPFSPGSTWHAALPLFSGEPDDRVLSSGTFSNGLSKAGYTALEAWAIEQHYYVGGK